MSEEEGVEKQLAEYILASDSEWEGYKEFIKEGGDPKETIWYLALSVFGAEDEVANDIEEYNKNKNKKVKPISQEEYLKHCGNICPWCRGENVRAESLQSDAGFVWHGTSCEDCGSYWNDCYKLFGYSGLNK